MPRLDDPVAVSIWVLDIRWYALFILAGVACAIALMSWLATQRELDPNFPLDSAIWIVLTAIVGARLYYLILKPGYYLDHPGEALNVRLGGLTIHGAIAGGALALFLYCRYRGEPFLTWGDLIVASLPVGQALGRWGNWANQEAFGKPTDLPWAVSIDPQHRPDRYEQFSTFHPTFLYESILDLLIAGILVAVVLSMRANRHWREGDAIWLYLMMYGIVRFTIESLRTDSLHIGPFPAAYWISWGLFVTGAVMFVARRTIWPGALTADQHAERLMAHAGTAVHPSHA